MSLIASKEFWGSQDLAYKVGDEVNPRDFDQASLVALQVSGFVRATISADETARSLLRTKANGGR